MTWPTKKTVQIGLAFAILAATSAMAEDQPSIPKINSDDYCTKSTAILGDNPLFKQSCLDSEASTLKTLVRLWDATPLSIKRDCIRFITSTPVLPSYQGLSGCLSLTVGNLWLKGELIIAPASRP